MNLCIISHERFGPKKGGVETVCYNLTRELQHSGKHKIVHLYANDKGTEIAENVICLPLPSVSSPTAVTDIRSFLSEHHIDIVWNHSPSPEVPPMLRAAVEELPAKIVSIYHSSPYTLFDELRERYALALYRARYKREWISLCVHLLKFPLSWLKALRKTRRVLRAMAHFSDVVCPLSEHYVKEFTRFCGRRYNNFRPVSNPLMPIELPATPMAKKNQLLVVARHSWKHKRIDRLILIWHKIAAQFPEWQLVILGDGPDHEDIVEVAQRLRVQNIVFTGNQDPTKYYAESKVICMTSGWEGLPMVLIEAQQHGCVPIAYESFSALPDIIENGETGFRIPPFNEQHFIEKLTYLMTHEEERERMAQNCVQHSKKFAVSNIADRWVSIFEELLSHP